MFRLVMMIAMAQSPSVTVEKLETDPTVDATEAHRWVDAALNSLRPCIQPYSFVRGELATLERAGYTWLVEYAFSEEEDARLSFSHRAGQALAPQCSEKALREVKRSLPERATKISGRLWLRVRMSPEQARSHIRGLIKTVSSMCQAAEKVPVGPLAKRTAALRQIVERHAKELSPAEADLMRAVLSVSDEEQEEILRQSWLEYGINRQCRYTSSEIATLAQ